MVTDDRTGSLVQFDVTEIVKTWQDEALANNGFVIRIVDLSVDSRARKGQK